MIVRLSAVLLLCSISQMAQDLKYKVSVELTVNDELRDVLTTALQRKIGGLNDVAVVNKDPQFIVRVAGMQTRSRRGSRLRLILGYNFTTVYESDLAPLFDPGKMQPEAARSVADLVKRLEQHQGSGVVTARLNDIEQACADIVAAFDSLVLDQNRRAIRVVDRTSGAARK